MTLGNRIYGGDNLKLVTYTYPPPHTHTYTHVSARAGKPGYGRKGLGWGEMTVHPVVGYMCR